MNIDPDDFSPAKLASGAGALGLIAYYARKIWRSDKQEGANSDLNVTLSTAAEHVIKMLEGRIKIGRAHV